MYNRWEYNVECILRQIMLVRGTGLIRLWIGIIGEPLRIRIELRIP